MMRFQVENATAILNISVSFNQWTNLFIQLACAVLHVQSKHGNKAELFFYIFSTKLVSWHHRLWNFHSANVSRAQGKVMIWLLWTFFKPCWMSKLPKLCVKKEKNQGIKDRHSQVWSLRMVEVLILPDLPVFLSLYELGYSMVHMGGIRSCVHACVSVCVCVGVSSQRAE